MNTLVLTWNHRSLSRVSPERCENTKTCACALQTANGQQNGAESNKRASLSTSSRVLWSQDTWQGNRCISKQKLPKATAQYTWSPHYASESTFLILLTPSQFQVSDGAAGISTESKLCLAVLPLPSCRLNLLLVRWTKRLGRGLSKGQRVKLALHSLNLSNTSPLLKGEEVLLNQHFSALLTHAPCLWHSSLQDKCRSWK